MAIDNVRLVASSTPTHCIEWSVDGHIAVNGGTTLTVFVSCAELRTSLAETLETTACNRSVKGKV